jgi:ATP-dependent Lon protease
MEVIDLSGYTTAEKLHIARRHLLPKQLAENGLAPGQLEISDESLLRAISRYTREAGVRDLQRKIASICRAMVERALTLGEGEKIRVEAGSLEDLLGPERYAHEVAEGSVPPGVATGLAWTPMGGEILFIEGSLMDGSGKLTVTGQLGEVMKESTQIALSLVRASLPQMVAKLDYGHKDVHIHVPAGGIPKDGPSAGVAMLASIASLFSGRSVSPKLAMTGEVTLRGAVMPVGGIKEKVLGAHRAGIERVILSRKNKADLQGVPEEVRAQMQFEFVDTASEVLRIALGLEQESPAAALIGSAPVAPSSPTAVA